MSNVVPHICLGFIRPHGQCSLEAAERHIIVLGIETAHTHVGEDLSIVHTHLEEPSAGEREAKYWYIGLV